MKNFSVLAAVVCAGFGLTTAVQAGAATPAPGPASPEPASPAAPAPAAPAPTASTAPPQPAAGTENKAGFSGLFNGAKSEGPLEINADGGTEWRQTEKVYIAHDNVVAKRGDTTLYADTLTAFYRDVPKSSQTEIWRVVADGHVKATTPTQTVVGDHGVYDLDKTVVVFTGGDLKLTTPKDVVTAKDSLEWYDDKQLAVARGDAYVIGPERRMKADTIVAQVASTPGKGSRISRVDGHGHVVVTGPTQVGTGDRGVYNVDTGIATLSGHVTLARGQDVMHGENAVVDMNNNISRLLPGPPTEGDLTHGQVSGYIVPRTKKKTDAKTISDAAPASATPAPATPATPMPAP